ncbi:MAG: hypothetical protein LBQ98_06185 [Nitrososphaerota archaeon]|nr:hypothetical protein [Nitrososphaerota archaeon]
MITVQTQINIQDNISLTNLSRQIANINLPKEILKITLIKEQEKIIPELCGPTYQRKQVTIQS